MYILNMKNTRILTREYLLDKSTQSAFFESFLYPDAGVVTPHSHEFFEIGITTLGIARHQAENHETTLTEGSVYFIPMGIPHAISHADIWQIHNIYLLPNTFSNELAFKRVDYSSLQYFISKYSNQTQILEFQLRKSTYKTICALLDACTIPDLTSPELLTEYRQNCLINILILICEDFQHLFGKQQLSFDKHLPKITALIHENLEAPVSQLLQILSDALQLHPHHLNRIVKKNLGISISQYIIACKIEKSIRLLSTDTSITEIAHSLGFYDHSHFHKYFTRYTGISPQEYRHRL